MDRLLKRIQWVRPAVLCYWDFFLLNDNPPAYKAASVCQFLTQKNVTTLYHPPYSPDLSLPGYFLFPKLKMKLKGLALCGWCWDPRSCNWWITEGPKRGVFGSFSETVQWLKTLYICQWNLFLIKKKGMCLWFLKRSVLKLLDRTVYNERWTSR